ncbi:hypothetical protein ANCCEY_13269 [Ancylostoma ceylanicum]|uniref:5'-nucleotidase n=1 Tax=Ancylostoma ceylanicum TaxID=53326 RepID=A0A0D6LJ34_9BILA|nr:hypothetical protein ANCCEY_13269 [Ancylostoma ceylanicum]
MLTIWRLSQRCRMLFRSRRRLGREQRRMNKNYQKAYSVCSSDEERAFVNNGWWNASHDLIIRSNMHRDDIPNLDGYVYGFTNPPLHSLCKNITRLRELIPGVDQKYAKRTNVLVIGDTDSDASMVDGWKGKCVLKVGLEAEEKPTLKRFDVVIKGSDCSRLIDVVRFILSPQLALVCLFVVS